MAGGGAKQKRDKEATKARLVAAVGQVLAAHGFQALGVNRVARAAGVDKVLIYRYFGGLDGLVEAFGRSLDFWPGVNEQTGGGLEKLAGLPLGAKMRTIGANFLRGLLTRPLTLEILAWEVSGPNEVSGLLSQVREQVAREVFGGIMAQARAEGQLAESGEPDLEAAAALIGAGLTYLALRSRDAEEYVGVRLDAPQGWQRILKAMDSMASGW